MSWGNGGRLACLRLRLRIAPKIAKCLGGGGFTRGMQKMRPLGGEIRMDFSFTFFGGMVRRGREDFGWRGRTHTHTQAE